MARSRREEGARPQLLVHDHMLACGDREFGRFVLMREHPFGAAHVQDLLWYPTFGTVSGGAPEPSWPLVDAASDVQRLFLDSLERDRVLNRMIAYDLRSVD